MDFLALAKARCSVREYMKKQIEDEKVAVILEAGRVAPTAVNYQPQTILKITDKSALEKLKASAKTFDAPLVLLVLCDNSIAWTRKQDNKSMNDIDGTIVADHMVLAAESVGLGTCWIELFRPEILRNDFNIPDNLQPIAMIAIGYAASDKKSPDRHDTERKPLSIMVVDNTF